MSILAITLAGIVIGSLCGWRSARRRNLLQHELALAERDLNDLGYIKAALEIHPFGGDVVVVAEAMLAESRLRLGLKARTHAARRALGKSP